MKKISSYHLVGIILVQIILLDVLLVVFLFKQMDVQSQSSTGTETAEVLPQDPAEKTLAPKKEEATDKKGQPTQRLMLREQKQEGFFKTMVLEQRFFGEKPLEVSQESEVGPFKKQPLLSRIGQIDFLSQIFLDAHTPPFKKTKILKIADPLPKNLSFIATAYDLSYESCGKYPSHPEYGITFTGTQAVEGRTVAVDPEVVPLGSHLYIEFPKEYASLDGWYTAEDTGRLVKGNIVDVFFGESAVEEAKRFGRQKVNVKVILPPD